jgi:transposase InsO family protein
MEAEWLADRTCLWTLRRLHPNWRIADFAATIHRSAAWVKKWLKRFGETTNTQPDLHSRSRARHHPPARLEPLVIERILAIRDQPPEQLGRIPGPKAILYYLQRDHMLPEATRLPRSTATIWRILHLHQRIARPTHRPSEPVPRPEPLTSWQLDFKDVTSAETHSDGKRQHRIEVLNTVDVGSSLLLDAQARTDFTAETALNSVAELLLSQGAPEQITIDRDPRWVGSQQQRDFPSAFMRFILCCGIKLVICPAHRPDKNGFVERYHRTYQRECLQRTRPADLDAVRTVTANFKQHYNEERPHQGLSCRNKPPRQAFPDLRARPAVPALIDPDRWLMAVDRQRYLRRVTNDGTVKVASHHYYVSRRLVGQMVTCQIEAATKVLIIEHNGRELKRAVIPGTGSQPLPFADYVERMQAEARSDARRTKTKVWRQHSFG